jgi:hypothetical protein
VNPLAAKPNEAQARLLEVVYDGRHKAGGPNFQPIERKRMGNVIGREADAWPIFQYVERVLFRQHHLEARELIAEAPSIGLRTGSGRYGWLHTDRSIMAVQPEDKVRLTIAGMAQVPDASAEVDAFLRMLALLVEREQGLAAHPTEVQEAEVWSGDIRKRIEQRWDIGDDDRLTAFTQLMSHEPLIWLCQVTWAESGAWHVKPSPFIRRFAGVTNADDYVDRLVDAIGVRTALAAPLYPSSLSLPEAIDYLNAVWRLTAGNSEALFRISRAEAAAKLALDCASVDELESRLSAFAGIMSQIRLPGQDGDRKLVHLRDFLEQRLDRQSSDRTTTAVDDLRAVVALRAWRQHPGSGVDKTARDAAQRLGIALPSEDWGDAWRHLRMRSVIALSAIREEIEAASAAG